MFDDDEVDTAFAIASAIILVMFFMIFMENAI